MTAARIPGIALIAAVITVLLLPLEPGQAAENRVLRVQGTVVAVNVADQPNVIVVKRPLGRDDELVVGAVLDAHTVVKRGHKRVGLDDLKAGEAVTMTYVKGRDGLLARTIQAR